MKQTTSLFLPFLVAFLIFSCGSKDDDCTKTITIPHYHVVNNEFKSYDVKEEVPCDFNEPENLGMPPELKGFTYEVLNFTFIPDTGRQTYQLKFEIKLNNPNNYAVDGLPYLTLRYPGDLEFTHSYSKEASIPCNGIAANSSCNLTFDKEYPLDPHVGGPAFIELVSVKYYVSN